MWRALAYCLRNDRPGAPLAGETRTLMRHANVLGKAQISRLSRIPMPTGFAHRDDWGKRIVFLDVETHTRGKEARIIELGMIIRKVGAQGKLWDYRERVWRRFNPGEPILPYFSERLHGIYDHDVEYEDFFLESGWLDYVAFCLEGADLVVGHHVGTDRSHLQREFERAGRTLPTVDWRCTLKLARERCLFDREFNPCNPARFTLVEVARASGWGLTDGAQLHNALVDAQLCEKVYDDYMAWARACRA